MDKTETFLDDRRLIIALLKTNPLSKIKYSSSSKCYTHNRKKLKGITSILKQLFWPRWTLPKSTSDQMLVMEALHDKPAKSKRKSRFKRRKAGMARGSAVGRAITKWANSKDPRTTKVTSKYPYVKRIIDWCKKNDAWPVAGELVVGDPEAGFATGVDLILMRKVRQTFKLELVEIKSGMGSYWKHASSKMKGRLSMLDSSPYWQAIVQLSVTSDLFRRQRPQIVIDSCAVVHVSDDGFDYTRIPLANLEPIGKLALKSMIERKLLSE